MKKPEPGEDQELELLKAVAQAWFGHSGNHPRSTNEFDARKSSYTSRPTRFKIEAMKKASRETEATWDFRQSLWDSYEIVTLSKKLEESLVWDDHLIARPPELSRAAKRSRESNNSLRNLLKVTSKRFGGVSIQRDKWQWKI